MVAMSTLTAKEAWRERMRAQRHIRPHVNPLQNQYTDATLPENFAASAFAAPLPLHVDIGCGKGHFCADLATARPDLNVLGIEIREPLVLEATRLAAETRVRNLCFLAGSANALLAPAIDALGAANHPLASASIQFPDPWPKARHAKRRVTTAPLVAALAERLPSGGTVLLQSDLQWLAEEMRAAFAAHPSFSCDGRWLSEEERPFPIATERERQAARRGIAVHRSRIVRR